ncbi:retrovirus-related pol polyprotein from transposon TNT 1-94 [Tanacetum coccineum]
MYRIDTRTTQTRAPQLPQTYRNTNPRLSTSTGVAHRTNVSGPQPRSTQMKNKVVPNTSQVKFKKTKIEDYHRISSISNQKKSVTACNDSLKSRTSNVNAVYATCGKCVLFRIMMLVFLNLVQGNITINRFYYVEGLNHNLFSVGQFCDADLEVAFWKSTCFVKDLQGNDLLTGNRGSDLYTIYLQETTSSNPICLMAKASPTQAWLWHRRLSHINFDYINLLLKKDVVIGLPKLKYVKDQLCSSGEASKEKRSSFKTKTVPSSKGRRNRTLVEAARTMLSASKLPLFFCAEAITTTFYTQKRSIIIPTHAKTAYHIINDRKPSIKQLHIFGCTCYLTRDGENLDKMKEKGDPCNMVGYSNQSKGYRVYDKSTRLIVESIHIRSDEIKEMSETSVANDTSGSFPNDKRR